MRWKYFDPNNGREAAERSKVTARIDTWWREFQAKTQDLVALFKQQKQWDLPAWMDEHLQGIDRDLMWEYGPAVEGNGHRLVITPESRHDLRSLVRWILERRPKIDGWEFYEHRLAEDLESTKGTVEARQQYDISEFLVKVWRDERNTIGLTYTAPSITSAEDQSAFGAAFVTTESLLGEEILNNWIGTIEISPFPRSKGLKSLFRRSQSKPPHMIGLDRLNETVHAVIGSIHDQLPPHPICEKDEDAKWTMWELKPDEADDYSGQLDMFVGKSIHPEQWVAAHSDHLFCSERFSRCGETFCYVKFDGSQGFGEDGFADKSEAEDALDEVLEPEGLGCHIGGGTGLRYSYIDLALTDVDKSIPIIRRRLQAGKAPLRSWIQFFDTDLSTEWIGIYDDTPEPPMETMEC